MASIIMCLWSILFKALVNVSKVKLAVSSTSMLGWFHFFGVDDSRSILVVFNVGCDISLGSLLLATVWP